MSYSHKDAVRDLVLFNFSAYGRKAPQIDTDEKARAVVKVWTELLRDIKPEDIRTAALRWQLTHKWPPTPAEIRELALSSDIPEADSQWEEVIGCFADKEKYKKLHDVTKGAVRALGGLSEIGRADAGKVRKEFIFAYKSIKEQYIEDLKKGSLWETLPHTRLSFAPAASQPAIEENTSSLKEEDMVSKDETKELLRESSNEMTEEIKQEEADGQDQINAEFAEVINERLQAALGYGKEESAF